MVEKKTVVIDGQEVTVTVLPPQPTPQNRIAGPTKGDRQRWLSNAARIKPLKRKKKQRRNSRGRGIPDFEDSHAMTEQLPLAGCEPCAYWSLHTCLKKAPEFPHVGINCRWFCREPGVDG